MCLIMITHFIHLCAGFPKLAVFDSYKNQHKIIYDAGLLKSLILNLE